MSEGKVTWVVETNYTAEDVAKARTYLYTVCTMTDRLLRIVMNVATKTNATSVINQVSLCQEALTQCLRMASDNNRHKISAAGQDLCSHYERQFVELSKEYILSRDSLKNAERLAYLLENLIWFVSDVIMYVPSAFYGTEWKELKKHLRALEVCICPHSDDLDMSQSWTLQVYDRMHVAIMLLPKGTEPHPMWED